MSMSGLKKPFVYHQIPLPSSRFITILNIKRTPRNVTG